MNNIYKQLIIIIIFTSLLFVSCKKFIDIPSPKNQLVTKTVFESNTSATAAIFNIYAAMTYGNQPSPYDMGLFMGLAADELTNFSSIAGTTQLYLNALKAIDAPSNSVWFKAYNYIYQANAIYEGCNRSTNLDPAIKKQITAEALFIRSFWNFYLVNLYGDIPLIITTDYTTNSVATRASKSDVYKQIINDLKLAENDLNDNYLGADYNITTERVRPNRFAAAALLARTYLYANDYSNAEQQATIVIENKSVYDLVDINEVFLKNNKEAIWQLRVPSPNGAQINTTEGNGYILAASPSVSGSTTISSELLNKFEENDSRLSNWTSEFTDLTVTPNVKYLFPYKYKIKNGLDPKEYSTIFRVAEQYLIRAEARAQQKNLSGAIQDLDIIRKRAGLPLVHDINPGIIQNELIAAIFHERQVELFTEWGHRWLDLKRSEKVNEVMNIVAPLKGGVWNGNMQLWPVPLTEIQNNNKLVQNPGYN